MDKSISAKDQTIEELVKSINSKNVWINRITLVSPGIILLIDLILKVKGITDTSLSKLLLQIVPPLCIIVPLYQLLDLHGLVIKKQQAENEPVDIPRSAISIYGRTIWDDARANIDYTKGITLLLEHGFDTLSQKLFASLVTLTATLATVEGSITACLSYLFIILVMYSLSFWSLEQMKQNKEERKMSEYLLLTISVLTNLLAFLFYFILVTVVYFSYVSTKVFFWGYFGFNVVLLIFIGYNYRGLIKSIKLRTEESSKKQENQ